jgi:two-component system chemotaxis sensor kinase CheA
VEAVFDASQLAVERAGRGTFVRVHGAPTLLRALHELLALDAPSTAELTRVVVVADGAARRAFLVGAVGGAQTVVVHAAGRFLEGAALVRSLVTTPDGRVAPLLAPGPLLAAAAKASAGPTAPHKRDATILVVDDSEIARQLVARHLVRAGFTVVEAMDGRGALLELSRRIPDAIVTDLQMPAMDGFQLLRAVRAAPTFSHVPVVVLSSLSAEADKSRAGALGADAYIVKETLDAAALHETLARLIA